MENRKIYQIEEDFNIEKNIIEEFNKKILFSQKDIDPEIAKHLTNDFLNSLIFNNEATD